MKHSRYFPYERNRYFYGKLLTVRDFDAEQKYVNDKRRLLNRLLHGSGVVSGLQVVPIDNTFVSVEMGVALDALGREIVLPSPVTLKLSMIEGFTNNEYTKNVYLCIAYAEKGKEPVHSVASSAVRSDEVNEHNRVLETYRLFIKEEAPNPASFDVSQLLEHTCMLYQDNQVRIWQKTPRYVNPEDEFMVTLVVEKAPSTPNVSFEYEFETDLFDPASGMPSNKISFAESDNSQKTEYEVGYWMKTKPGVEMGAKIAVKPGSARLVVGDRRIDVDIRQAGAVEVVYGSVPERIMADYHRRTLDKALESTPDTCIHLAKISLLNMGATYVIDHVEPVPFNEYVYNTSLLYRLGMMTRQGGSATHFTTKATTYELTPAAKPELSVNYNAEHGELDFRLGLPKQVPIADEMRSGTTDISLTAKLGLNLFAKGGKRHYSEEIEHGLGKGAAFVIVGIEQMHKPNAKDFDGMNDAVYGGDTDVFAGSPYESELSGITVGTVVYPAKGTFRIGVKVPDSVETGRIRLRWWAYRKQETAAPAALTDVSAAVNEAASANESGGAPQQ